MELYSRSRNTVHAASEYTMCRGGQANIFTESVNRKATIAYPQVLTVGVPVGKSQIRKFLWLICKSQIR